MEMKSDSELQKDVLAELQWEPSVKANDIGVIVKDGVVTLTGNVDSFSEKWESEHAALRVSGVRAAANEIEVKLPGDYERTDEDIALEVTSALKWNSLVPEKRIRAVVEDGWVTLKGEVEWLYQKSSAETAVRHLIGVRGVINEVTIKPRVMPSEVKGKIEAAFKRHAALDAQGIQVETNAGKVTLRGKVHSWAERDEAWQAAWSAPGVNEVKDNLTIAA
jgi:osmotically-inducible protein OsmY